jgi:hypothetical protein
MASRLVEDLSECQQLFKEKEIPTSVTFLVIYYSEINMTDFYRFHIEALEAYFVTGDIGK